MIDNNNQSECMILATACNLFFGTFNFQHQSPPRKLIRPKGLFSRTTMVFTISSYYCAPQRECDSSLWLLLLSRLVPKPNCVKVPKEICVNSKTNPRVVKKPIIKEWCYRPSDLKETPGVTPPTADEPLNF